MSLVFTFNDSYPMFTSAPLVFQRSLQYDLPMSWFHCRSQYYLIKTASFETSEYFVVQISRPPDSRGFESFEMTMSKRPSSDWVRLTISDDNSGFSQKYWYRSSLINSEGIEWNQKQNTLEIKIPKSSKRQEIRTKRREAKQKKSKRKQEKMKPEQKSAIVTPPEQVEVAMKECEGLLALQIVFEQLENKEEQAEALEQAGSEPGEVTDQAVNEEDKEEGKEHARNDEDMAESTEQADQEVAQATEYVGEVKVLHHSEIEELTSETEDTSNLLVKSGPYTEEEKPTVIPTQETYSKTEVESGTVTEEQGSNVDTDEAATGKKVTTGLSYLQGQSSSLSTEAEVMPESAELEKSDNSNVTAFEATANDNDEWVDIDADVTPTH